MYIGKSYSLLEFIIWTRKRIYMLTLIGLAAVILYHSLGFKWLGISWTVVALLGTATAFIVGFKNTQTYNRTTEALQIWTGIMNASRSWGLISRDFIKDQQTAKILVYRHLAWLTALRYDMRNDKVWESTHKSHNTEYSRFYSIPEHETPIEAKLGEYLTEQELVMVLNSANKAVELLSLQSRTITEVYDKQQIAVLEYVEMQRSLKDFFVLQGRSEQIKHSPYPRQYAIINTLLVRLFCFLLPFGMLKEFEKLNEAVEGIMRGNMVWLVIPFSVVISWMYTSLEQVGESTENPFEGSPNDVPISDISARIEADLRQLIGEPTGEHKPVCEHDIIM